MEMKQFIEIGSCDFDTNLDLIKTGRWHGIFVEPSKLYRNNLKEVGFEDGDFENGGSDKLVDAIVAWGDESVIRERIQQHLDAGADHVCIQPFTNDGEMGPDQKLLELLAPAE